MPEILTFVLKDKLETIAGTIEEGLVRVIGFGEFQIGTSSFTIYSSGKEHCCGAQGFGQPGDECPACIHGSKAGIYLQRVKSALGY